MRSLWLAGSALLCTACLNAGVRPTPEQITRAEAKGVSMEQLDRGRVLFDERCTDCHMAPDPHHHRPVEWAGEVRHMSRRAHLSREQRTLITWYLQAVSVP